MRLLRWLFGGPPPPPVPGADAHRKRGGLAYALARDFQTKELIEFAQRMRQYPSALGFIRGFFPSELLEGMRAIIDAFKKRVGI